MKGLLRAAIEWPVAGGASFRSRWQVSRSIVDLQVVKDKLEAHGAEEIPCQNLSEKYQGGRVPVV